MAATGNGKVREVLVVDDLPEIGEFFRSLMRRLHDFDIRLTTEADSVAALQRVRDHAYDLVITDFRMAKADGVDILSACRQAHPEGLRVLMTGYNEIPTSMDRIRQAGVDAYIQKPLKAQDILLLIFDFLNGNKAAIDAFRREARELETMGGHEEAPTRPK
jgi:DNA-binding NtrC family response regulator